jgi:hypothetical protein
MQCWEGLMQPGLPARCIMNRCSAGDIHYHLTARAAAAPIVAAGERRCVMHSDAWLLSLPHATSNACRCPSLQQKLVLLLLFSFILLRPRAQVRDAFRRFMAAEPAAWDYSASDIPSPLTEEMESAQQSKKVRCCHHSCCCTMCCCCWC